MKQPPSVWKWRTAAGELIAPAWMTSQHLMHALNMVLRGSMIDYHKHPLFKEAKERGLTKVDKGKATAGMPLQFKVPEGPRETPYELAFMQAKRMKDIDVDWTLEHVQVHAQAGDALCMLILARTMELLLKK